MPTTTPQLLSIYPPMLTFPGVSSSAEQVQNTILHQGLNYLVTAFDLGFEWIRGSSDGNELVITTPNLQVANSVAQFIACYTGVPCQVDNIELGRSWGIDANGKISA